MVIRGSSIVDLAVVKVFLSFVLDEGRCASGEDCEASWWIPPLQPTQIGVSDGDIWAVIRG